MAILALDIGGTHVSTALITDDLRLQPAEPLRAPVNEAWPADDLLNAWAQLAAQLAARPLTPPITHVALSMPGPFDYHAGVAQFHQKLRALTGMNITDALQRRWAGGPLHGLPLTYINDAVAFALGEAAFGHGVGAARLIGITLGTGIGSGFIEAGAALTHHPDVPAGGMVWHLPFQGGQAEDALGSAGLRRSYVRLGGLDADLRTIAARATAGEAPARALFTRLGRDLGTLLRPWAERFQPGVIVFGGQLSRAWPLFQAPLTQLLDPFHVARSDLLDHANLLGAALAAHHLNPPNHSLGGRPASLKGGPV